MFNLNKFNKYTYNFLESVINENDLSSYKTGGANQNDLFLKIIIDLEYITGISYIITSNGNIRVNYTDKIFITHSALKFMNDYKKSKRELLTKIVWTVITVVITALITWSITFFMNRTFSDKAQTQEVQSKHQQ